MNLPAMQVGVAWDYVARRVEMCTCGGLITAVPDNDKGRESAVRRHQATLRHLDWRARRERE